MAFRDDHDAALARANALENEVERVKRERDELEAKMKALEVEHEEVKEKAAREDKRVEREKRKKEKRKERASSSSESSDKKDNSGKLALIFTAIVMGPLIIWGSVRNCGNQRDHDDWNAKTAERSQYRERWQALTSIEPCLRRVVYDMLWTRRIMPGATGGIGSKNPNYTYGIRLGMNCLHGVDKLIAIGNPKTTAPVRAAVSSWIVLQKRLETIGKPLHDYYSNGDYREDKFAGAPALWAPVLPLLEQHLAVTALLRRDAVPAIRDEIRTMQRAHEARSGKDNIWWRVELSMRVWEINDRAFEAAGIYAGREPDLDAAATAVRTQVKAFVDTGKQAPIELRRELRKIEWITDQIVAGGDVSGETPLWHLSNFDTDLIGVGHSEIIPALPPDPGPRPPDYGD